MTKTKHQRLVNMRNKDIDNKLDFYETPEIAIDELLKFEKFKGKGWEPASGKGVIAKKFKNMIASDICKKSWIYGDKGVDFLKTTKKVDFIITNPPYKYALEFAKHAVKCAKKVALLLRLQFLESKQRYDFFKEHPPKYVYVFSRRISCNKKNRIMCFCWFVWERNFKGETMVRWLYPDKN